MAAPVKKTGSKKSKKNVPNGVVHIQSTFNNTIGTFFFDFFEPVFFTGAAITI